MARAAMADQASSIKADAGVESVADSQGILECFMLRW